MKAIFITYDQAHHEKIIEALDRTSCRGFTSFGTVQGRGSKTGEPHYGSHAWPSLATATITMVEDDRVEPLLERLRKLDEERPLLGLRAFVWTVEQSI
ncbi:MAG: hypothetical protein HDS70_01980 [Bacteroidales bacterium]|nr:hypothetical protein [Bacteroidales bacterium]MBD5212657.1 hypothetical protein [Bacteroidales bacterium]MBD5217320.1 hypothetical protein [Bacteroidales bacterium]MBD5221120.1 hypothetical protein [Bacteroidales bacterium]